MAKAKTKSKKKAIQKKIKAKQKVIALRKKGKKVPQKLLDLAYGKSDDEEEEDPFWGEGGFNDQ